MPLKCRSCGQPEDLAEPLIDGSCAACLRRDAETKPAEKVTFVAVVGRQRSNGRWSGGLFLTVAALLGMQSIVLGIAALASAGVGFNAIANGDASYAALPLVGVVLGIGSVITGLAAFVMLWPGSFGLG